MSGSANVSDMDEANVSNCDEAEEISNNRPRSTKKPRANNLEIDAEESRPISSFQILKNSVLPSIMEAARESKETEKFLPWQSKTETNTSQQEISIQHKREPYKPNIISHKKHPSNPTNPINPTNPTNPHKKQGQQHNYNLRGHSATVHNETPATNPKSSTQSRTSKNKGVVGVPNGNNIYMCSNNKGTQQKHNFSPNKGMGGSTGGIETTINANVTKLVGLSGSGSATSYNTRGIPIWNKSNTGANTTTNTNPNTNKANNPKTPQQRISYPNTQQHCNIIPQTAQRKSASAVICGNNIYNSSRPPKPVQEEESDIDEEDLIHMQVKNKAIYNKAMDNLLKSGSHWDANSTSLRNFTKFISSPSTSQNISVLGNISSRGDGLRSPDFSTQIGGRESVLTGIFQKQGFHTARTTTGAEIVDRMRTYSFYTQHKKQEREMIEEVRKMKDCTFTPQVLRTNKQRRSADKYFEDQQKYQKKAKEKVEIRRMEREQERERSTSAKPRILKKSSQMVRKNQEASFAALGCNLSVFERLNQHSKFKNMRINSAAASPAQTPHRTSKKQDTNSTSVTKEIAVNSSKLFPDSFIEGETGHKKSHSMSINPGNNQINWNGTRNMNMISEGGIENETTGANTTNTYYKSKIAVDVKNPELHFTPNIGVNKALCRKTKTNIEDALYEDAKTRRIKTEEAINQDIKYLESERNKIKISDNSDKLNRKKFIARYNQKYKDICKENYCSRPEAQKILHRLGFIHIHPTKEEGRLITMILDFLQGHLPGEAPKNLCSPPVDHDSVSEGISQENLCTFLLGVLNIHNGQTQTPAQEHTQQTSEIMSEGEDMNKMNIVGVGKLVNGVDKTREIITNGEFVNEILYLTPIDIKRIHKQFMLLYTNSTKFVNPSRTTFSARTDQDTFKPKINNKSKKLAEKHLQKVNKFINTQKMNELYENVLLAKGICYTERKMEKQKEYVKRETLECQFKPKILTNLPRSVRSRKQSPRDNCRPEKKCEFLYELSKHKHISKMNKTSEQISMEKANDDLTFRPIIHPPPRSKSVGRGRVKNSEQNISRIRDAWQEKQKLNKFIDSGLTNSIRKRSHSRSRTAGNISQSFTQHRRQYSYSKQPVTKGRQNKTQKKKIESPKETLEKEIERIIEDDLEEISRMEKETSFPLLKVEVNLGEEESSEIIVFLGENIPNIITKFAEDHDLSPTAAVKLLELVEQQYEEATASDPNVESEETKEQTLEFADNTINTKEDINK